MNAKFVHAARNFLLNLRVWPVPQEVTRTAEPSVTPVRWVHIRRRVRVNATIVLVDSNRTSMQVRVMHVRRGTIRTVDKPAMAVQMVLFHMPGLANVLTARAVISQARQKILAKHVRPVNIRGMDKNVWLVLLALNQLRVPVNVNQTKCNPSYLWHYTTS